MDPDPFELREKCRKGNTALVRHVNGKRLRRIKTEAVVRKQDVEPVAANHFFGIVVFVFNDPVQVDAVFQEPKPHVESVLRVNNAIRRSHMFFQFQKNLVVQRRIRSRNGKLHLGALPQKFLDDGDTTGRMTQSPVQWRHQDFHYLASSHALAQSP